MHNWIKTLGILATATAFLGGCAAKNDLKAENESLRTSTEELSKTNEELNQKLELEQAARREADSKRQALDAEIAALRQIAANPATPERVGPGNRDTRSPDGPRPDVIITVAGDVAFGPGQATLTAAGKRELDQIARDINRKHSGQRVRVEGYTDTDPVRRSKWGSNEALSQARADSVEKYLISKGVSNSRITAVGMGAKNPKATKASSRRVEIVIVGG
jgi:outer membrane protein OmpA-like peptidoglycan-associated protein